MNSGTAICNGWNGIPSSIRPGIGFGLRLGDGGRWLDLRQCRLEPGTELLSSLKCSVLFPSKTDP